MSRQRTCALTPTSWWPIRPQAAPGWECTSGSQCLTQVLIARGGGSAGNMAAGYWVQGISEAQEAEEELQCLALDVTNRNESPVQLSLCIYI